MPRFINATARASLPSISPDTESASTGSSSAPTSRSADSRSTPPPGKRQPGDREHDRELIPPVGEDLRGTSLGQRGVCGRRLEGVLRQLDEGEEHGQLRMRLRVGGEGREQAADGRDLAVEREAQAVVGEQALSVIPVAGGLGVTDRDDGVPMLGEPGSGDAVQVTDDIGLAAPKLEEQEIREERVVAEPRSSRVDRYDERVGVLQLEERALRAAGAGEAIGEGAADPLEDRGAEQEAPDLLGLALEDLGQQVVRHRPLAAGELGDEPLGIRVTRE